MGIDIHMWIEGKDVEGNWFVANPRYVDYKNPEKVRDVKEFTVRRDYALFSALANIENVSSIPYIQENRGLPEDVSDILKEKIDQYDSDQFSFGNISYNELEEYLFTNMNSNHLATIAAIASIQNLYRRINELCFEIIDDDYNSLDKNTVRLVFWFD